MICLFIVLGHSKILGTNLNAENGEFLIISAEISSATSLRNRTMNAQEFTISKSLLVFMARYDNVYLCKNIFLDLFQ